MGKCDMEMKLRGSVTVGEKGQIVIPKEVRDLLNIKPGDSLVTLSKGHAAIGFIKNENMQEVMSYIQEEMKST